MISVFAVVGANVIDVLPPFIKASFKVILPAVFGAVYVELASKHLKMGTATIVLAIAFTLLAKTLGIPGWVLNIAIIAGGILVARAMYLAEAKKG